MNLKEKQIIYVDDKPHIKCNVVMLPTISANNPIIYLYPDGKLYLLPPKTGVAKMYHLYITSNEEIKEDDWFITIDNSIQQARKDNEQLLNDRKIIATTEKLITVYRFNDNSDVLPQPSQQFIEKYIKEYNKGNIITEILVEIELINKKEYIDEQDAYGYDNFVYKLKLDSQNQITIRKQKDSWSREEHCENLHEFAKFANNIFDSGRAISIANLNEWIEKNL